MRVALFYEPDLSYLNHFKITIHEHGHHSHNIIENAKINNYKLNQHI